MTDSGNWTRKLAAEDLGLDSRSVTFDGTITLFGDELTVYVKQIEGEIKNGRVFSIVANLTRLANANGANKLVITCTIANERLLQIVSARYNSISDGGSETITIDID